MSGSATLGFADVFATFLALPTPLGVVSACRGSATLWPYSVQTVRTVIPHVHTLTDKPCAYYCYTYTHHPTIRAHNHPTRTHRASRPIRAHTLDAPPTRSPAQPNLASRPPRLAPATTGTRAPRGRHRVPAHVELPARARRHRGHTPGHRSRSGVRHPLEPPATAATTSAAPRRHSASPRCHRLSREVTSVQDGIANTSRPPRKSCAIGRPRAHCQTYVMTHRVTNASCRRLFYG